MLLRNVFLGFVSVFIFFTTIGYVDSANIKGRKLRVCNNEQCIQTSELIDITKYKDQDVLLTPEPEITEEEEIDIAKYLTLIITGAIPTFGFVSWLVNSQQEKKITEFSQTQDIKFKVLMKEVVDKQELTTKSFGEDFKELIKKIDSITQTFQDNRLEYVERLSHLNEKIATLTIEIKLLQSYIDKIDNIESFLNKQFEDYHIHK